MTQLHSSLTSSIHLKNHRHHPTDTDICVHNLAQQRHRQPIEHQRTEICAHEHCRHCIAPCLGHMGSEESRVGTIERHHAVANQEIALRQDSVSLHRLGHGEEIQHGGRPLHDEQSAHHYRHHYPRDMHRYRRPHPYPAREEREIHSREDERGAENISQHIAPEPREHLHGKEARDEECGEDRQQLAPGNLASVFHGQDERCDRGEQSRQRRGLAIRRHYPWQHCHDEYSESESRGALHECRADGEQYECYHLII